MKSVGALLLLLGLTLSTAGCSYLSRSEPLPEEVGLIAVLPIERAEAAVPTTGDGQPNLEKDAEDVITAQIYGAFSDTSHWRFVPDLAVSDAMRKVDHKSGLSGRAVQLGKLVKADAVLCGVVSRFAERVGSEYGATEPASVGFALQLISTKSGTVLWHGEFDETQEPLSSNLFDAWMFWSAGPHWFSAAELSRLGINSLLEDLDRRVNR